MLSEILDKYRNQKPMDLKTAVEITYPVSAVIRMMEEYAYQFTPQWIKVTDRLPEFSETVLFCTNMGYVSHAFYDGAWIETFIGMEYTNVTHWMPLPEPPEV